MEPPSEEIDQSAMHEERATPLQFDWRNEQRIVLLAKTFRIARKYHARAFMTNFKSTVLQRLLQNHARMQEQQLLCDRRQGQGQEEDWPYRSLLLKPNKTEHELLEIEFVSMCAEKIQAVFKGYLARKRFKLAFGRLKSFTGKLKAMVRGWKVRCVMRCLKVQEEARSLRVKRAELQKERENGGLGGTRFSQRRLDYLKNSLQAETGHFLGRFTELYEFGAWVYEPRTPFPAFRRVQKWSDRKQPPSLKENTFTQQLETAQFVPAEPEPKKKRVREVRENARRGRNRDQETKPEEPQKIETNASEINFSQASTSAVEDRPIQAKGAYSYQEEQQPAKIEEPQISNQNEDGQENENRRAEVKKIEKKKLEKRQKYDPRKAIEEEKKRKKEMQDNKPTVQAHSETEIPPKQKPVESQRQPFQSKSQKTLKPQKQQHSRSTVNLPKNKPKVQAKIDCWGNRKTVAKKQTQQYIKPQQFIKAKVITPALEIEVDTQENRPATPTPAERLAARINERRGKGKERLEYSEEREKARLEMEKNCEESERIKEELRRENEREARQAEAVKQMKAQALRQRAAQQQKQRKKDLVYRSVQQLSQTYKNQYLARFQNLFPKLSLLAAARNSEQHSRIPVLTLHSDFVERMMDENKLNQRFWYTVSKMERSYKDFVRG